jgi:hypothetical protein
MRYKTKNKKAWWYVLLLLLCVMVLCSKQQIPCLALLYMLRASTASYRHSMPEHPMPSCNLMACRRTVLWLVLLLGVRNCMGDRVLTAALVMEPRSPHNFRGGASRSEARPERKKKQRKTKALSITFWARGCRHVAS